MPPPRPSPALRAREGANTFPPLLRGGGLGWGRVAVRNPKTQQFARALRNEPTDCERKLWQFLRLRQLDGFRFRRQVPIGRYIADFACIEAKLIIELDGGQHQDSARDLSRDAELIALGYCVLRFWNNQVLQETEAVLEEILRVLRASDGAPRAAKE